MNAVTLVTGLLSLCFIACNGDKGEPIADTGGLGTDGSDGEESVDNDGDGFIEREDCDDDNPEINPDAEEVCDGVDNNCDTAVDEGVLLDFFIDIDDDGYGSIAETEQACEAPVGYADNADDCNDEDDQAYPGAAEVCNGLDNNCNGEPDDGVDLDGDGFIDASCGGDDCNDGEFDINPGAEEICDDGLDNNCDGGSGECAPSGDIPVVSAHAILRGEAEQDRAGQGDPGLASAGDVNGDGFGDLIIGAIRNDEGANNSGAAYIVYGPISGEDSLTNAGAKITGEAANDFLGRGVNGLGDVNNDGYDDVVAVALLSDLGGTDGGTAYVFHGPLSGTMSASTADLRVAAEAGGDQLADAERIGDTDGDGLADLLLTAQMSTVAGEQSGAAWVVLSPATGDFDLSADAVHIDGAPRGEQFGSAMGAGDFNGDGLADAIIGARYADHEAENAGAAYLFYGPLTSDLTADDADTLFTGQNTGDQLGTFASVANGGDLNGDGTLDLVMGATENAGGGYKRGATYVFFTPVEAPSISVADADSTLFGEANSDKSGDSVDGLGDFDGDGFDDLVVGSGFSDASFTNGGAAYLVLGPLTPGVDSLRHANARYTAEAENDRIRVQAAGDVNNDGRSDLFIGAQNNSNVGFQAGAVYLFNGTGM